MHLKAVETAVVVIDMQEVEYDSFRVVNREGLFFDVQTNINFLTASARKAGVTILHVTYDYRSNVRYPTKIKEEIPSLQRFPWHSKSMPIKGDFWMQKIDHSLFGSDETIDVIRMMSREIRTLIMTGVHTGACVFESVRGARSFKYDVVVPRDTNEDCSEKRQINALKLLKNWEIRMPSSSEISFE
jgi:nicotinamidase-related amidase